MKLGDRLAEIERQLLTAIDAEERTALAGAIERLRMLQIVEQGLAEGDLLPDFALPDTSGQVVSSADLLDRGPLVLAFFRGPWCPYCSLMVEALDQLRPEVEALGGSCVAVAPLTVAELDAMARERGLGLPLLSDADSSYAGVCGVRFEMTPKSTALYGRLAARYGQTIPGQDAPDGWVLPVPTTYVAGRDGVITYSFGDANWARRADPGEILAAVERLVRRSPVPAVSA